MKIIEDWATEGCNAIAESLYKPTFGGRSMCKRWKYHSHLVILEDNAVASEHFTAHRISQIRGQKPATLIRFAPQCGIGDELFFRNVVQRAIKNDQAIIFDLTGVLSAEPALVGMIVLFNGILSSNGKILHVIVGNTTIEIALKRLKLDTVVPFYRSLAEVIIDPGKKAPPYISIKSLPHPLTA